MKLIVLGLLLAGCQTASAPRPTLLEAIKACQAACAPNAMEHVNIDNYLGCSCQECWRKP